MVEWREIWLKTPIGFPKSPKSFPNENFSRKKENRSCVEAAPKLRRSCTEAASKSQQNTFARG